ncbi:hypothetical protein DFS34DRAFT_130769 [Phlyctochytrium arcticum]|nr:hypothetical protein DFS34DRAFT_130769 [Phlyctochytrium arcticum]
MGPDRLWAAAAAEEEVEGGKPDALQLDSLEMPACLKIGRTGLESILRAFGRALTVLDIAGFPGEYRTDTLLPCIPSLVDLNISSWRCPSVNEAAQLVTLLKASNQLKTFIATNVATSLSSDSLIVGLPDTLKKLSRSELGTSSRPQGSGFDIRLISGKFQYPNLTELHLAGLGMRKWSLEDIEPQDVEGLWPHMRHIDVSRNPLGDEFVAMLAGACPRLESILLSQTNVTGNVSFVSCFLLPRNHLLIRMS